MVDFDHIEEVKAYQKSETTLFLRYSIRQKMRNPELFKIILLVIMVLFFGCKDDEKIVLNTPQVYSEIQLESWLREFYIENRNLNNLDDNLIYNSCLEVCYKYQYEKNGDIKYFNQDVPFGYWSFVDQDELNMGVGVKSFKLTSPVPILEVDKYNQSIVKYEFFDSYNKPMLTEETGVVENHQNIVIHNPRAGFFMSLFSSFPWPCIKFPIQKNKQWNWSFHAYGDNDLFDWKGKTLMNYSYSYLGESILNLPFGKVEASKFEAIATNGTISNKLVYHFNTRIGFVRQEFYTYDGATILIEAFEYSSKCD